MKPEKLIIEGVYSYKNKTVIDFSTLCTADLFGIFGKVGSGKSAVLEAVTYVLYGKIDRLSSKMMNYNMMNLASDRMFIDFTFAHKDQNYRFTFEARRNKKDFGKIETPKRSAYIMKDENWLPLFDKNNSVSADEIIGLSYDNFRRTVIVPQGRFQEFLHLEKKARTEMLMELFQLNRFDLYAKAASLSNRNTAAAASLEGALSGLQDADEQTLTDAEKEMEEADEDTLRLSELIEQSDTALRAYEELAGLMMQLAEAETELESRNVESAIVEKRKALLLKYEDCRSRFESQLNISNILSADLKLASAELEVSGKTLENHRNANERAQTDVNELSAEFRLVEEYRKQAEWFFELSGIENDRGALSLLGKRIEAAANETERFKVQRTENSVELDELKVKLDETGTGSWTTEKMGQLHNLYNSLNECNKYIISESEKLEAVKIQRSGVQEQIDAFADLDDVESVFGERETAYNSMVLNAQIIKGIGELALNLEEGKPCPVCGSTTHPSPVTGDDLSETELEISGAELETERSRLKDFRRKLNSLQTEAAALDGRIEALSGQIDSRKAEKNALLRAFPDCDFLPDKPQDFMIEYELFNRKLRRREQLQAGISELNSLQEQLLSGLNSASEALNNLRLEDATARTRISETEQRMDSDFLKKNNGRPAEELAAEGRALREKAFAVSKRYQEAEEVLKKSSLELEGSISTNALLIKRVEELSAKTAAAETALSDLLRDSEYESLEMVKEILAGKPDIAAERAEIEGFEQAYAALKSRLETLRGTIDGRSYQLEEHRSEKEKNLQYKQALEALNKRLGELKNKISDLRSRLERKKELEKELAALRLRGENINTLKNLFKGKQFIDYAATIYLRELCEAANERFRKLTRESLRLELDESNNFIIRDYLNEGKTRSVKTLSGGQTFQAAFSLSLALADSIGRERSGFFFLDEGFGSLDRESLSLVFESLKSLKKEERTVGIISHVEELKQEIDTFITIEKDNEEGSLIINSWNS